MSVTNQSLLTPSLAKKNHLFLFPRNIIWLVDRPTGGGDTIWAQQQCFGVENYRVPPLGRGMVTPLIPLANPSDISGYD